MDVRKSLKTTSWDEAEYKLREMKESPAFTFEQPKKVEEAVLAYLTDARSGQKLTEETLRKKRNVLKPMVAFCEDRGKTYLKQINFEDLAEFRTTWKDQALSASKKLERLRGFFRFCVNAHWIKENPAVNLKPPKVPPAATMPFTRDQMSRLLSACDQYPDNYGRRGQRNALRLRAMLLVLRYTGLRIRDAVQLDESKAEPCRIFVRRQQKTGEPVFVPVPSFVTTALAGVPGRTSPRFYFWSGRGLAKSAVADWQRSFRKLFALAGLTHIPEEGVTFQKWKRRLIDGKPVAAHPHMFRDTFAVELLLSGVPMEDVQILLGHTSIRTTERSYAPWVKARQERLEGHVRNAWNLELESGTPGVHGVN
jgi:site-specific recombinase XerD